MIDQIPLPESGPASQRARLVVLASGNGTNLQAVLDACTSGVVNAEVAAVFSDKPQAYALERARLAGVPAVICPWTPYKQAGQSRQDYDHDLAVQLSAYNPDWIILAGWMRVLSSAFLSHFPDRVINLHPALPGTFPGTHAIERAWDSYKQGLLDQTGVMVHLVPDEGVDSGPVIAVQVIPIQASDSLEGLTERIHEVEHRLLVRAIQMMIEKQAAAARSD